MKFSFNKMDNLRNLLKNCVNRWSNLRLLLKPYLNYCSYRCLDLVMICAGIDPIPGPEPWKRHCLTLYRLLGFYQLIMSLARIGFSIYNQDDLIGLCSSIVVLFILITCLVKVYMVERYRNVMRQSKVFTKCNIAHSGDPDYDASVRRDSARSAGKITLVIFLLLCCDQVTMVVPSSARDLVYGIPKQFHLLGPIAARFLQEAYVFLIAILWGNRYFSLSLTVMPLLMGLRSELKIIARGYETILNRVQAQISEELDNTVGQSRKLQSHALKWKYMKQILGTTLDQHVEILRDIKLVQDLVSVLYAITYYSSMLVISICVLLVTKHRITLNSLTVFSAGSAIIMECYFWCHLIDSIEEIMDLIAGSAAQLGAALEHSSVHHSEYVQMRTSLMIIQLNASQGEWFSCGGVFPISVEAFGDLCMIIYRFATFLLNIIEAV